MSRSVYGTPVLTLSELVEDMMISQNNDRQSHYMAYLKHAERAWKKLLWNTIWSVRQQWVDIDTADHTLKLPSDLIRLVGFSVVDSCGNQQPITLNPNINTLELACPTKKCSCKTCEGNDTLCEVLDSIMLRTEDVELNGQIYKKRIWNRMDEKGNLMEITEAPAFLQELDRVEYTTLTRMVCALEVDERNCIVATTPNRQMLIDCIGCYLMDCALLTCGLNTPATVDVQPYNSSFGHWKWDAKAKDKVHFKHLKAERVIVTYQSSGECSGAEMLVPEYAVDAVQFAMLYRMAAFNPSASRGDKQGAKDDAAREKNELLKFLHPIRMSTFMRLSEGVPKW